MNTKLLTFITIVCIAFINHSFAQKDTAETITINEGSGFFNIKGGTGHETDTITVYYYKPKNLTSKSKILMVIPGAGRNGDSYRDSWIEASEKHNVLILAPAYAEKNYSYANYHLGGLIKDLDMSKGVTFKKNSNQVIVDEDIVKFIPNSDSSQWIFHDFDRIFMIAKSAVKSKQHKYDMFGHSAGGQILHRFALIYPNSKANWILASNAGSYTLPDTRTAYPFGVKSTGINNKSLKKSFKKDLVLFLGELDNANEKGGKLLRSKTADKQGTHRLERGTYFYKQSKATAEMLETTYNWKLEIIPGVGHNQRKMAKAAAVYLYENH
ncbi:hypothetical protein [Algibacter mikhailovii]|uniref:Hydrolase n=1 Tax=Algibacter mikhailovii TaxID=425498 RepID=A0A918VE72_9FLAO|nr:hypothetical protein [Algibacter mikhailovii]GGZ92436.1 hydrolase [Algibacter mikhailovii]